jgi:nucleotide-binding universal stress UspA family protein
MVEVERQEAQVLLDKLASGLRDSDGLSCQAQLVFGEPFEQIPRLAEIVDAELVVIGPYRRDRLKNIFVGATAERIIRSSERPVLMANGLPAAPYQEILLATDFSEGADHAMSTAKALGLLESAHVSAAYVYQVQGIGLRGSTAATGDNRSETISAQKQMNDMAQALGLALVDQIAEVVAVSAAETIRAIAARLRADLVVIGATRRSPLAQAWLSGVAQDLLRFAETDILVVPGVRYAENQGSTAL